MSRLLGVACNSVTLSNTLSLREEGVFNFCWLLAKGTAINLAQKWDKRNGRPAARRWWTCAIYSSILSPPLRSRAWWEYNIKHWVLAERAGTEEEKMCFTRSQNIWRVWFLIIIYIIQGSDHIPHFSFRCKWNIRLEIDIIHSSVFIRDELQTLAHLLTLNNRIQDSSASHPIRIRVWKICFETLVS